VQPTLTTRSRRAPAIALVGVLVAISLAASAPTSGSAAPPQQLPNERFGDVAGLSGAPGKPSSPLIDSRLEQLTAIERREGAAAARRFAADNAIPLDEDGRARVLIHQSVERDWGEASAASGDDPEQRIGRASWGEEAIFELLEMPVRARVAALGGTVDGRAGNLIDARMPLSRLRDLEGSFGMGWVEPAAARRLNVTSQGVDVIQASTLQSSPVSYQGAPVRVGVLDVGFKGYQSLLGSELPASVTTMSFHPGGIEGIGEAPPDQVHGTACAEVIHDVAPNAELFLANFNNLSDNDAAVDWMIEQGVDVISYSIGWFNVGPGDGRGPVNDAVQRALDAGIEFVTSAGNDARNHWEGVYSDPDGNGWQNFSGSDEGNSVFLSAGDQLVVFLNWDDWFTTAQDYDLYIFDAADNVVAASTDFQTGLQSPTEAVGFTAPVAGTYSVAINRWSATRDVTLEMFFFVNRDMQYLTPAGSLGIPADTAGAVAVGATYWGDDVIEWFSSQGPTTDGRIKPDISAPDGVASATYGTFFGTSAAAPHAAGAIALMKSRFGVFELPQIREILYGRAVDRGVAGKDNIYGFGRLDVVGR